MSLNLRVALKDHLLLNSAKCLTWQEFKSEIVNYRRATQAVADSGGVAPMDVGAFTKGDKGRGRSAGKGTQDQTCHNCGGRGHFKKDCKKPGGGAHWLDSRDKDKPKSKGQGKGRKGQTRETKRLSMLLKTTTRRSTMMRKSKNSKRMGKDWVHFCVCFEQTAC